VPAQLWWSHDSFLFPHCDLHHYLPFLPLPATPLFFSTILVQLLDASPECGVLPKKEYFVCLFIYMCMCIHCLGHFSTLPPDPPASPPQFQAGPVLPSSLILLKKGHKHNKKDKVFLLVEFRIAIRKDSYYCFHIPMCYNPCWLNSNWSLHWFLNPAHDNLSF
jgi:hypothetical protein